MNTSSTRQDSHLSWENDLKASRNLKKNEQQSFGIFLHWFEQWTKRLRLPMDREAAKRFWKEAVVSKKRDQWQHDQWAEAMRWYLGWRKVAAKSQENSPAKNRSNSLAKRVQRAVNDAGARRGLAYRTRQTYGGWAARYAATCNDAKEVMDPERARRWLMW